jgi:hypothetical protein
MLVDMSIAVEEVKLPSYRPDYPTLGLAKPNIRPFRLRHKQKVFSAAQRYSRVPVTLAI